MNPIIKPEALPAILSAIEIIKADPSILRAGQVAANNKGDLVSTLDPTATCWCLVGLIARERGVNVYGTDDAMRSFLTTTNDEEANEIWGSNDEGVHAGQPLKGVEYLEGLLK